MAREVTMFSLKIPKVEKEILELFAKSHGISLSELFRKGARFIGTMNPGFVETIEKYYAKDDVKPPIALELAFQRLIASERAWEKTFASLSPGAFRHHKYDENGKLIRGDDLSKILEHEYTELFQTFKEKLMDSEEKGEPVTVSVEEFSEFVSML